MIDGLRTGRVLLVGTGAGGGVGRVEQTLCEAARAFRADHPALEFQALWRRRHPAYLQRGAIERLPATVADGNARFAGQLTRALARTRPDYVFYTHVNLARLAPLVPGHPPYAVWVHGIEVWEPRSAVVRRALRQARLVLASSSYSAARAAEAQGVDPERLRVVPLTLAEDMFRARLGATAREPGRLLTVARLASTEAGKNVEAVIAAVAELRRRGVRAQLVLVGDGDDRARLEALAAGLDVQFLGAVTDAELRREYERADVFVLPSAKEGFGLVFLEAMLHGNPVVGLATGGPLDLVRDGVDGRLLERLDELPDALEALLADRAALDDMRLSATERARVEFSPARFREVLFAATAPRRAFRSGPPGAGSGDRSAAAR